MKSLLIRQAAGLGDIFFLQKIVKVCLDGGYKVIYPVFPHFMYLNDYIYHESHEDFKFISSESNYQFKEFYNTTQPAESDELLYVPFSHAQQLLNKPHNDLMTSKYYLVEHEPWDWAKYFTYKRNREREDKLYYEILNLKDDSVYDLVNKYYSSPPNSLIKDQVSSNTGNQVVDLKYIDGINVFDWCKVLENATNIFSVDTSILYIMEKMQLRCETEGGIYLWGRSGHLNVYKGLLSKKYIDMN